MLEKLPAPPYLKEWSPTSNLLPLPPDKLLCLGACHRTLLPYLGARDASGRFVCFECGGYAKVDLLRLVEEFSLQGCHDVSS